jgi:hypothetical protein
MQIVDKSFRLKLSSHSFECKRSSGSVTPSNATELDYLCQTLEREYY